MPLIFLGLTVLFFAALWRVAKRHKQRTNPKKAPMAT
jgi:hypothetical protein